MGVNGIQIFFCDLIIIQPSVKVDFSLAWKRVLIKKIIYFNRIYSSVKIEGNAFGLLNVL